MTTLKPSSTLLPLLVHVIIFAAAAAAPAPVFNITEILEQHPHFAAFNGYLTSTGVAGLINSHRTITVLAVDNAAAARAFSGKPASVVKDVLSAHVVLDFYGPRKLRRLFGGGRSPSSLLVTTLFQASGRAAGLQGFLNVSAAPDGIVEFGSGVRGSPPVSRLVDSVAVQPYDISIVHVTAVVFPPGVDPNPSPPPPPAAVPAPEAVGAAPAEAPQREEGDEPRARIAPAEGPNGGGDEYGGEKGAEGLVYTISYGLRSADAGRFGRLMVLAGLLLLLVL